MKLLFASSNTHKISEIRQLLPAGYELVSLSEAGFHEEIPETADTIEGNALLKAQFMAHKQPLACFADDTGLVIPELNGEPGVYSARYAGPERSADANMHLVLKKLEGSSDRRAYFMTVIALWINNEMHLFEGRVAGTILTEQHGTQGFGYDPIFQPEGHDRTFAEMNSEEKNALSHRGRALQKMVEFLRTSVDN
jgi:XTP/dITP diphosphohydrolase